MKENLATEASPLTGKRVLFVINPAAGDGLSVHDRNQINGAMMLIQTNDNLVDVEETLAPEHATEISRNAIAKGIDTIVAVGGDGTLNEIVQATAKTDVALGMVPTGFLNVWAREMDIPQEILPTTEELLNGQTRTVDIGNLNGTLFLQFANLGFDSEQYMKSHPPHSLREGSGKQVFWKTFARCMRDGWLYRGHSVEVTSAGQKQPVDLLVGVIGNSTKYGTLPLRRDTIVDDGSMEVTLFTGKSGVKFLPQFGGLLLRSSYLPGVEQSTIDERITIECSGNDRIGVTIDGNPLGYFDTISNEIIPKAQKVLLPHNAPVALFEQ